MIFRTSPHNHIARILAALIALSFGMVYAAVAGPVIGAIVAVIGLVLLILAVVFAVRELRVKHDRYDLKKLWDELPPENTDLAVAEAMERNLVYCHNCGTSMPADFARCPECGSPLKG